MNSKSLFLKTSIFFLIVLTHSALTKHVYANEPDPEVLTNANVSNSLHFRFDGKHKELLHYSADPKNQNSCFTRGLVNQSFRVGSNGLPPNASLSTEGVPHFGADRDFSVVFWIRTTARSSEQFVVLATKQIPDNSLQSQKKAGWAFSCCDGTWAWNIGCGDRRLTYERDNGQHMLVNDGRWHQLAMTYDRTSRHVRLYFDGVNRVTYNLADKDGFDFSNDNPLTIGWSGEVESSDTTLPIIKEGAGSLQDLVDHFNGLELGELKPNELMDLVIGSERLVRGRANRDGRNADIPDENMASIKRLVRKLSRNPYTVHQVADFMQVAPMLKLYRLVDGQIEINQPLADKFAAKERLSRPNFDIDELSILQRKLDSKEIAQRYSKHFQIATAPANNETRQLTAAAFNIHHGGKHETIEEDGWDSRELIAEIIRREGIDVVMMQETYSSGDFIAAELGYYFATTVDWDYLNQGANISVLSRYPIDEINVPPNSSFMNVAARVSISETQDVYVMSNWYGMNNFKDVFKFHESRFAQADDIPVLFAGDFNAVPHTEGGRSPASKALLESGFRDAFRESFPDAEKHPGATHQSGGRIDQLYYKGRGLKHESTRILSTWPSKFPSDHFLIKSVFQLDFQTPHNDQ